MLIYEEILREFQKKKVKYILVGGIAVNLLGALRSTADLDILVEMEDINIRKIIKILKKLGYRVKQPVDPMDFSNKTIREDWIKNKHLKAFNFYKDRELKEVDIIIKSPVTYKTAIKKALRIKAGNVTLPVISIGDLIKMKKEANRDLDKFDIQQLREIARLKRHLKRPKKR